MEKSEQFSEKLIHNFSDYDYPPNHKNIKAMVCSLDEDTDFFGIVAGVLQRDTLVLYLFIIYLDYILQTLIDLITENGFILKKSKKQMIPCRNSNRCRLSSASCKSMSKPNLYCMAWGKQQGTLVSA